MARGKKNGTTKQNPITVFDYDAKELREHKAEHINEVVHYKSTDSVTWINIDSVPPISFLDDLRLGFDLHPVIVDDILTLSLRPKLEVLNEYFFVSMQMLHLVRNEIVREEVSMVVAKKFVLTFQQGIEGDSFEKVRAIARRDGTRLRERGTDYLAYDLIDAVIEHYQDVQDWLSDRIEAFEEKLANEKQHISLRALYKLKHDILTVRKVAWPLRDVVGSLERVDTHLIHESTRIYFRESYVKLSQILDTLETYRDMTTSLHDASLARINTRTNDVVKVLTVITTIFMPLSFIASFFGMNFTSIPWITSPSAPYVITVVMVLLSGGMLMYFKKMEWL